MPAAWRALPRHDRFVLSLELHGRMSIDSIATLYGMRGGYFKNGRDNMRTGNRSSNDPVSRPYFNGVRCAR